MAFANGYTMALAFNVEPLGWIYISIATLWTIILVSGLTFLMSKRNLPFLRIRNVPLTVSTVATLHVYWVLCMVAYILQGFFPCATEFWIMSIYLPLGIALFQACNTQLLHIADLQRKYTRDFKETQSDLDTKSKGRPRGYLPALHVENRVRRTLAFIAYGMGVQVLITMGIFLVSRKFHASFGLTGSSIPNTADENSELCLEIKSIYHVDQCDAAARIACRRGWEWIPSTIWQFFWSWCYAPYLLWQVRDIKDVHGWRKQTTFCCLAGLFATPMWLCALYIREMYRVNRYYVPPLWFAPSIFLIEAFLVFVPCWQVTKNHRLQTETLDIIAEWECKNNGSSVGADTMASKSHASKASKKPSKVSTVSSRRGEMYTMTAMESAIRTNPQPLLLFAALKDFSGENISFLINVINWKRAWSPSTPIKSGFLRRPSVHEINDKSIQRQQFKHAIDIYASYASPKYSEYTINLSHAHLKELEAVFEGAASILYNDNLSDTDSSSNSVTPFDNPLRLWPVASRNSHSNRTHEDIEASGGQHVHSTPSTHTNATNNSTDLILTTTEFSSKRATILQAYEMSSAHSESQLPEYVPIPRGFGPEVFDRAEESIKYMVLTNTWPKFVNAGYAQAGAERSSILESLRRRFLKDGREQL